MITKDFVTAGRAVFTVENPNGTHHTYRVGRKDAANGYPETFFANLLSGPDNTSDYTYIGVLNAQDGTVRLTKASQYNDDTLAVRVLRRVLARLWANDGAAIEAVGWNVHHCNHCGRCNRLLTTPDSVTRGIGPECLKAMEMSA